MRPTLLLLAAFLFCSCQSGGTIEFPRSLSSDYPDMRDLPSGDHDILLERVQNAQEGEAAYQAAIVAYFEGHEGACLSHLRSARRHFQAVSTRFFTKRADLLGTIIGQICSQRADQLARLGDHQAALNELDDAEASYRKAMQYDGGLKKVLAPRVIRLQEIRGESIIAPTSRR